MQVQVQVTITVMMNNCVCLSVSSVGNNCPASLQDEHRIEAG